MMCPLDALLQRIETHLTVIYGEGDHRSLVEELVDAMRLRERVTNEIRTTFASEYTAEVSLAGALALETLRGYQQKSTGEKVLICPQH